MAVSENNQLYSFLNYTLDPAGRKLYCPNNKVVILSSRAFEVLLNLLKHQGEILSKKMLMEAVWPNVVVEENNLNQAISSLRKALNDPKTESKIIQTVPGRGYCFVAQVELVSSNTHSTDSFELSHPIEPASKMTDIGTSNKATDIYKYAALCFCLLLFVVGYLLFRGKTDTSLSPSLSSEMPFSISDRSNLNLIEDSIAVIPFTVLNPNESNEAFSLGLHDELINQLSKIQSLNVISRSSVLILTEQGKTINEIGQALRIESALSGTILFTENQARVNLQLLDPHTGITIWTSTYDTSTDNLSDMIAFQSDISTNIANALEAEIQLDEKNAIALLPTESFEAYRYNLAAKFAHNNQDFETAWTLGKQAIEHDPNYIDALLSFSLTNYTMTGVPLEGTSAKEHFAMALEAAEHVISLEPQNIAAHVIKATAHAANKDWIHSVREIETLIDIGAPLSQMRPFGAILLCLGDFQGAIDIYKANLVAEPVNLYGRGFLLAAYELAGQRDMARIEYQLGEELNPNWWGDTINIFLSLGRNEALENIGDLISIPPELKAILENLDDVEFVAKGLLEYKNNENKFSAELVYYGAIAAFIDDHNLALELMKEAVEDVSQNFFWLWLPVFDETRKQTGFKELLVDSGIVNYWQEYSWPQMCQASGASFSCDWQAYP